MKTKIAAVFMLCIYMFLTPGFQCGHPRECTDFTTDTSYLPFHIPNSVPVFHVGDSVKLASVISDTVYSTTGQQFVTDFFRLTAGIQAYKVSFNGSIPQLNYANNEFNAYISTGAFDNSYGSGYAIIYQRQQPYNRLSASLVPGQPGLYIVTVGIGEYAGTSNYGYYINNGRDLCKTHIGELLIPAAEMQKQYWDSLGVSSLALSNSSYYTVQKNDANYFFMKVLP
ncbi:MAG: hypothetical protein U0T68_02795 [Ferruginibacter sp.]